MAVVKVPESRWNLRCQRMLEALSRRAAKERAPVKKPIPLPESTISAIVDRVWMEPSSFEEVNAVEARVCFQIITQYYTLARAEDVRLLLACDLKKVVVDNTDAIRVTFRKSKNDQLFAGKNLVQVFLIFIFIRFFIFMNQVYLKKKWSLRLSLCLMIPTNQFYYLFCFILHSNFYVIQIYFMRMSLLLPNVIFYLLFYIFFNLGKHRFIMSEPHWRDPYKLVCWFYARMGYSFAGSNTEDRNFLMGHVRSNWVDGRQRQFADGLTPICTSTQLADLRALCKAVGYLEEVSSKSPKVAGTSASFAAGLSDEQVRDKGGWMSIQTPLFYRRQAPSYTKLICSSNSAFVPTNPKCPEKSQPSHSKQTVQQQAPMQLRVPPAGQPVKVTATIGSQQLDNNRRHLIKTSKALKKVRSTTLTADKGTRLHDLPAKTVVQKVLPTVAENTVVEEYFNGQARVEEIVFVDSDLEEI